MLKPILLFVLLFSAASGISQTCLEYRNSRGKATRFFTHDVVRLKITDRNKILIGPIDALNLDSILVSGVWFTPNQVVKIGKPHWGGVANSIKIMIGGLFISSLHFIYPAKGDYAQEIKNRGLIIGGSSLAIGSVWLYASTKMHKINPNSKLKIRDYNYNFPTEKQP